MGGIKALILFVIFALIIAFIATGGKLFDGIPVTGLLSANPNSLDAAAAAARAQAQALENQAQQQRSQQAQATQSYWDQMARETQAAGDEITRQTAAVVAQQTATAWEVTVEAAKVQDTATAQALSTQAMQTQIVVDNKATADALVISQAQQQQTKQASLDQIDLRNKQVAAEVGYQTRYYPTIIAIGVLLVLLTAAVYGGIWLMRMRDQVNHKTAKGADGEDVIIMNHQVIHPDRMTTAVVDPRRPAPELTADQLDVTKLHQGVQGIRALNRAGLAHSARAAAESLVQRVSQPALAKPAGPEGALGDPGLPVDVPWSVMDSWPGRTFALGMGQGRNMIEVDPDGDAAPHFLGAGTTGSGKSHYLLHPVITQALAMGYLVVALDRTELGTSMFAGHSNFQLIKLDDPTQAAAYLEAAYRETQRRESEMARVNAWKWSMWKGAPRVMFVIDELSNLIDDMDSKADQEQLWRRARMVAAEGRKAGIYLALALQDPSHESLDLRIRRNCTPVAYQVQDAYASRLILQANGAENLAKRHFMTRINGQVQEGVAFDLQAAEVQQFLARHPIAPIPEQPWIRPEKIEDPTPPLHAPEVLTAEERDQRIRQLYSQGKSINQIQIEIFGYAGGAAYSAVKTALNGQDPTNPGSTTTTGFASTAPSPAD